MIEAHVYVSENAAALEELLLEYESKQMSKGSSIKYVTAQTHQQVICHAA